MKNRHARKFGQCQGDWLYERRHKILFAARREHALVGGHTLAYWALINKGEGAGVGQWPGNRPVITHLNEARMIEAAQGRQQIAPHRQRRCADQRHHRHGGCRRTAARRIRLGKRRIILRQRLLGVDLDTVVKKDHGRGKRMGTFMLKHFPEKWEPVFRLEMRKIKQRCVFADCKNRTQEALKNTF